MDEDGGSTLKGILVLLHGKTAADRNRGLKQIEQVLAHNDLRVVVREFQVRGILGVFREGAWGRILMYICLHFLKDSTTKARSNYVLAWKCVGSIFTLPDVIIPTSSRPGGPELYWDVCMHRLAADGANGGTGETNYLRHVIKVMRRLCNAVDFPLLADGAHATAALQLAMERLALGSRLPGRNSYYFAELLRQALVLHDYDPPVSADEDNDGGGMAADWVEDILVLAMKWIVASASNEFVRAASDAVLQTLPVLLSVVTKLLQTHSFRALGAMELHWADVTEGLLGLVVRLSELKEYVIEFFLCLASVLLDVVTAHGFASLPSSFATRLSVERAFTEFTSEFFTKKLFALVKDDDAVPSAHNALYAQVVAKLVRLRADEDFLHSRLLAATPLASASLPPVNLLAVACAYASSAPGFARAVELALALVPRIKLDDKNALLFDMWALKLIAALALRAASSAEWDNVWVALIKLSGSGGNGGGGGSPKKAALACLVDALGAVAALATPSLLESTALPVVLALVKALASTGVAKLVASVENRSHVFARAAASTNDEHRDVFAGVLQWAVERLIESPADDAFHTCAKALIIAGRGGGGGGNAVDMLARAPVATARLIADVCAHMPSGQLRALAARTLDSLLSKREWNAADWQAAHALAECAEPSGDGATRLAARADTCLLDALVLDGHAAASEHTGEDEDSVVVVGDDDEMFDDDDDDDGAPRKRTKTTRAATPELEDVARRAAKAAPHIGAAARLLTAVKRELEPYMDAASRTWAASLVKYQNTDKLPLVVVVRNANDLIPLANAYFDTCLDANAGLGRALEWTCFASLMFAVPLANACLRWACVMAHRATREPGGGGGGDLIDFFKCFLCMRDGQFVFRAKVQFKKKALATFLRFDAGLQPRDACAPTVETRCAIVSLLQAAVSGTMPASDALVALAARVAMSSLYGACARLRDVAVDLLVAAAKRFDDAGKLNLLNNMLNEATCTLLGVPQALLQDTDGPLDASMDDVDKQRELAFLDMDRNRSLLRALGRLGAAYDVVTRPVLLRLCFVHRHRDVHRPLVAKLVDDVAAAHGYRRRGDVFLAHAGYLAEAWVRMGLEPLAFPLHRLFARTETEANALLAATLGDWVSYVYFYALESRDDVLASLGARFQLNRVLESKLGCVLGTLHWLHKAADVAMQNAAMDRTDALAEFAVNDGVLLEATCRVFDMAALNGGPHGAAPDSVEAVEAILRHGMMGQPLLLGRINVVALLLHLFARLRAARRPAHLASVWRLFELCVDWLRDSLEAPGLARVLVHACLFVVSEHASVLGPRACAVLQRLPASSQPAFAPLITAALRCAADDATRACLSAFPVDAAKSLRELAAVIADEYSDDAETGMTAAFRMSLAPKVSLPLCLARLENLWEALQASPGELRALVDAHVFQHANAARRRDALREPEHVARLLMPDGRAELEREELDAVAALPRPDAALCGRLIDALIGLCGAACPSQVRTQACRCLCELALHLGDPRLALSVARDHAAASEPPSSRHVLHWLGELAMHERVDVAVAAAASVQAVVAGLPRDAEVPSELAAFVRRAPPRWIFNPESPDADEPFAWALWSDYADPGAWAVRIASALCGALDASRYAGIKHCGALCGLEEHFATYLFPTLVHAHARSAAAGVKLGLLFTRLLEDAQCPRAVHRLLLQALSHLRAQRIRNALESRPRVMRGYLEFEINVDVLLAARVAVNVGMPETAILNLELHCQGLSVADAASWTAPEHFELLLKAHRCLGDFDSASGVPASMDPLSRARDASFWGDAVGALSSYDGLLASWEGRAGAANELQHLGLVHVASKLLLPPVLAGAAAADELACENAWRRWAITGEADASMAVRPSGPRDGFQRGLLSSLAALQAHNGDELAAHVAHMRELALAALADRPTLAQALAKLRIVAELDCVRAIPEAARVGAAVASWDSISSRSAFDFAALDAIMLAREGMLRCIAPQALTAHLWHAVETAMQRGSPSLAASVFDRVRALDVAGASPALELLPARVCWALGKDELAVAMARRVAVALETSSTMATEAAAARCLTGLWLAQATTESRDAVVKDWLERAIALMGPKGPRKPLGQMYGALAAYLDGQLRSIDARLQSQEYKDFLALQRDRKAEVERLGASTDRERKAQVSKINKELDIDAAEDARVQKLKRALLEQCVDNYLHCMRHGAGDVDPRVTYRVVGLWFDNDTEARVGELIVAGFAPGGARGSGDGGDGVPTAHLVPLIYQLVARLAEGGSQFSLALRAVLVRLSVDHPHHSLPHLFALVNAHMLGGNASPGAEGGSGEEMQPKAKLAASVIAEVEQTSEALRRVVVGLRHLSEGLIALAYHDSGREREQPLYPVVAFRQAMDKIVDWASVAVPTIDKAVHLVAGEPRPAVSLMRFSMRNTYTVMDSGVSRPKLVCMLGSDGQSYKVLVKGTDDLRQDGVMEQLLKFVSGFLERDPKTRLRRMRLRTYNVQPLTPKAGLIEFVEDTTALGSYLVGRGDEVSFKLSAHFRHAPSPTCLTFARAQHAVREAMARDKSTVHDWCEAFRGVCAQFPPVFRHFFFEQFGHDPREFVERRLAYTRSTAANSMVGMILGIGDRHTHNILIDQTTAEVVHIDFGVAFEQGKLLKVPEIVPYRLTRDLVDALGVTGVHGAFSRACEETLAVLREHQDAIVTILEVFVHDPLYVWTVTADKAKAMEGRGGNLPNVHQQQQPRALAASRALFRVRQKLQGAYDDSGELVDVAAQVKRSIFDATSEANLARMYHGWAAFV